MRYGTISIGAGAILRVTSPIGGMGRVIAFVADGTVTIDGTLDISARGALNGPGGGQVQSGGSSTLDNGGGGAGGATAGADGADEIVGGTSVINGGPAALDPASLQALVGGAASPQLVLTDNGVDIDFGGGGGGGGITLVSCRSSVIVSGTILAAGGGGLAGQQVLPTSGYGGGAGGNVVLQGIAIEITGQLFSNGGGGGAGRRAAGAGLSGSDGLADTTPALGGVAQDGSGRGGAGGTADTFPSDGLAPTTANAGAGGGGGSVGFLQTYTPAGVQPLVDSIEGVPQRFERTELFKRVESDQGAKPGVT